MIPRHKSSSAIEGEKGLFRAHADDEITCADYRDAKTSTSAENSGVLSWHIGEDALSLPTRTNFVDSRFGTKKAGCTRCFDVQR
eukprot:scaffold12_cov155-Amphora_coffeaeformis.AAC.6